MKANEPSVLEPGASIELGPYQMTLEGPPYELADPWVVAAAVAAENVIDPTPVTKHEAFIAPLDLYLARERLSVEPGRQVDLQVEVINRGEIDDRVRLRVQGLPADWVSLPDTFVAVEANESTTIPIIILPPRHTSTAAGRQRFRIELVSQQYSGAKLAKNATLEVGTFESFEASIEPRQVQLPGIVRVALRNTGNQTIELSVLGRDPIGQIQFRGERGRISLKPGQVATVDVELESRQQSWFGSYQTYGFEIEVRSRSGARQTVMGRAQSSSLLPVWIAYVALFLVIFICTISLLVWVFGGGGRSILPSTNTPVGVNAATETAAAVFLTATAPFATQTSIAATEAAVTADAAGDRDQDGLSDAQEGVVGTDPDNPDTDGDGLLDGEEVLTWGTNPLNRDTDADILIDGDEVRTYGTNPTNPDTDGDTFADGVEIANGWDPLNPLDPPLTPTFTSTATPVTDTPGVPTITASPSEIPSATSTIEPSITPSPTNTEAPTLTSTPTIEPTFTFTPIPTFTPTPEATPTETPTVSITLLPSLAISCVTTPPTIDGVIQVPEWPGGPLFTYSPEGDPAREVSVYFTRDVGNFYLAYIINDATLDATDSLKVYFDANNNAGDPDSPDRFFQIARDGTLTVRAGKGTNTDLEDWDTTYTSDKWTAAIGEPGGGRWVVEMQIDLASELPLLLGSNPFGFMNLVLYGGSQGEWPESAVSNDAGTWQPIGNTSCL
jgi:hypothetical protein